MSLIDFMKSGDTSPTQKDIKGEVQSTSVVPKEQTTQYSDSEYYNMLDEDTGFRYNIPMLDPGKPGYYYKYINMMKERIISPDTFNKIMGWN